MSPGESLSAPRRGWLVTPAGEGPHPLILAIHGGPHAAFGFAYQHGDDLAVSVAQADTMPGGNSGTLGATAGGLTGVRNEGSLGQVRAGSALVPPGMGAGVRNLAPGIAVAGDFEPSPLRSPLHPRPSPLQPRLPPLEVS